MIKIRPVIRMIALGGILVYSPATQAQEGINDSNTPLHLLKPAYPHPYGEVTVQRIEQDLSKILRYLDTATPARVLDRTTGKDLDPKKPGSNAQFAKGDYRLFSYEWGVTYAGMLAAYQATGDVQYKNYLLPRLNLLADLTAYYRTQPEAIQQTAPVASMLKPHALDDAGALCMAMIQADKVFHLPQLKSMTDVFIDFIRTKEYRLPDGTFARNRPLKNTVWLDDLFMGMPALAYQGFATGESAYFQEAIDQTLLFSQKMFDPQKNLFIHGYISEASTQPRFHWGRANGWAIMAITELLSVLPKSHPQYNTILALYRSHVQGLAAVQSGKGFWHQLLDRNDSYLETSATAIFTYCLATGINQGWLPIEAYGPMTILAWEAVSTQITQEGKITGTCVGTGMGFDPAFYYYRPVNPHAAHSYGPVLLAGAEMIQLLKKHAFALNETAIQFQQTK